MYLTIGSSGDLAIGDPEARAAIHRYNPDGTGDEIVASGLRNTVGLRFYPGTTQLWASVEERTDAAADVVVADFFTSIRSGGFYGWPYAYVGPHAEPRVPEKDRRPDLVAKTTVPDVVLTPHCAVLDFVFYTGTQFPAEYRNGAFLANHGSTQGPKRVGYSISFVPFQNGRPAGPVRDFATGWSLGPDRKEVWGRPVGLLQLRDGSLLVSDDGGKTIWRVTYKK
jgi:glucose/arabinose dehydrogenase